MNHVELLESCAAYALGVLDAPERRALEHHLATGCSECASELAAMREATGILALAAPPARPTLRLRRRLLSRVGDDAFYFVLARERDWETPSPGVRIARLFIDPRTEGETVAIDLDAGVAADAAGLSIGTTFVLDGAVSGSTAGPEGARLLAFGEKGDRPGADLASGADAGAANPPVGTSDAAARRRMAPLRIVALAPDSPAAWRDLGAGCHVRHLGPVGSRAAHVIRVDAGRAFPEHDHGGVEELFVLSGDCVCEGEVLGPGDYHRAPAGSHHAPTPTHRGCSAIVIG